MATTPRSPRKAPGNTAVPPAVQAIWATIKDRTARQLFHPDEARRLEAVAALEKKHPGYDARARLLLHAALQEPLGSVRAAMLGLVASTAYHTAWREYALLREHLDTFAEDPTPATRVALARCLEQMPIPLRPKDLAWIAALLETPEGDCDAVYASACAMVARAIRQGVATDEAIAILSRMMRHPAFGYRARWEAPALGPRCQDLLPSLIARVETDADDAHHLAGILVRCGSGPHDRRVIAALEALRDRRASGGWVFDLQAGLFDRATLPDRLARHAGVIETSIEQGAPHPVALDAMSWVPAWMARCVDRCAHAVMTNYEHGADGVRARWIDAQGPRMASVLRPRLRDASAARIYLPWWDRVSPDTAAADAVACIDRVLAESRPGELLAFEHQSIAEACCALLSRVGQAPPGTLARLAALTERQAPQLLSMVMATVRAMHDLRADEADFAPVVAAYERLADANDARAAREPRWDPERAFSANLRRVARFLPALGRITTLRAQWDVVAQLLDAAMSHDRAAVLTLLGPHREHPEVRAALEAALARDTVMDSHTAAKILDRWSM
ncbi:MAG: hypothetical protein U0325_27870 [Polyangiales bacterium]